MYQRALAPILELTFSRIDLFHHLTRARRVFRRRAVETIDFVTVRRADLPYRLPDHVSRRVMNEIDGISRVYYHIFGKTPGTIEWK